MMTLASSAEQGPQGLLPSLEACMSTLASLIGQVPQGVSLGPGCTGTPVSSAMQGSHRLAPSLPGCLVMLPSVVVQGPQSPGMPEQSGWT